MAVDDNWGEALRKSAEQVTPGDKTQHYLKINTAIPPQLLIPRSNVAGFRSELVNAHNLEINRVAREDIWDDTGAYPFPASAFTPVAASSNVNDTVAGTGARTIRIEGVDAAGAAITSEVDLDGTTEVTFPDSIFRINKVSVIVAGNTGFNEGDITVLTQTAGTTVAKIITQLNETLSSIRTVPNGQVYYILCTYGSVVPTLVGTGLKEGELILQVRSSGGIFMPEFATTLSKTGSSKFFHPFTNALRVNAGGDIKMEFIAHQNNTKIVSGYELIIEDLP